MRLRLLTSALPKRPLQVLLTLALGSTLNQQAAQAQGWTGLANSNYAGTNALYWNPANIADSRYKVYVSLGGGDVNFYNNYLSLRLPYTPWQLVRGQVPDQYRDGKNNVVFKSEYLQETVNGDTKSGSVSAEVRLPAIMVALGQHKTLALSSRVRGFVQATGVSEPVARLGRYGFGQAQNLGLANQKLTDEGFNLGVNAYHEIALTYAQEFSENQDQYFKGGFTVKYLTGLASAYFQNEGVNYEVYKSDSIKLTTQGGAYGATDYKYYDRKDFKVSDLYNKNRLGLGGGFDVGMVYEWRPDWDSYAYTMDSVRVADPTRNKYKLKIGGAITDVGFVQYDNPFVRTGGLRGYTPYAWGSLDTTKFHGLPAIDGLAQKVQGLNEKSHTFQSFLPTALHLTADYRIRRNVFLGAAWTQNMLLPTVIGSRVVSSVALTPRLEFKHAEVAMPVIWNAYHTMQVGAMVRLGPLVLGSDNLGSLFGGTTFNGYDVYASVGWGIGKTKIKDRDRDGISDRVDKCPQEVGTWEFRGCADRDGDHVPDAADTCPDVPGLAKFHGCPDTDEDGLVDSEDNCPTEAGPAETHGCPDRDGDNVKDSEDLCPDDPGSVAHFGCPDSDADGVFDNEDKCPTEAGPVANEGCPVPDQDGDGVLDVDDACPTEAGPAANHGCPSLDTDQDGTLDAQDECPTTPGPKANHGCPVLKKADQRIVQSAFEGLHFQTGKDVIAPGSYPSLNSLAKLLLVRPNYRLHLTGHTDNVGLPENNMLLSQKRANAVHDYLTKHGVPAEYILVRWFGQTQPRVSNKTDAGRAKNRRVEMTIEME